MEYRRLGKSELKVSVIGLGTWAIDPDYWGPFDESQAIAAIRKAIDEGITLIDTAPFYGNGLSEEVVGKAVKGRRHLVSLATKCGLRDVGSEPVKDLRPASIRRELEDSLNRLGVDCIDLYQCHWPDPATPIEETMGEMARMQSEGKIRYIGVSNFDAALLQKAQSAAPVVSNQVPYSMLNRAIEKELIPFCRESGTGILAYGPLGGGILTGKYREKPKFAKGDARSFFYRYYQEPQWSRVQALLDELGPMAERRDRPLSQLAANWVRQQPGVTSALVGARNPRQAEANSAAGGWQLTPEELTAINRAINQALGPE